MDTVELVDHSDESNTGEYILGGILAYNVAFRDRYLSQIYHMLLPMMADYENVINGMFSEFDQGGKTDAWLAKTSQVKLAELNKVYSDYFRRKGKLVSKDYQKGVSNLARTSVRQAAKPFYEGRKEPGFKGNNTELAALGVVVFSGMWAFIRAQQSFYNEKITYYVNDAVKAQDGSSVSEYMDKQRGITERQAKNKFGDLYRQDFNSLSRSVMTANYSPAFIWIHTDRAEKAREYHKYGLNGNVFYTDRPPVIDQETGETGYPGQLWGCQCMMRMVKKL